MAVLSFGSINMDLVVRTPRFTKPGETLTGSDFYTAGGGKGANQSVAAGRLGTETRMFGRVGDDIFGNLPGVGWERLNREFFRSEAD